MRRSGALAASGVCDSMKLELLWYALSRPGSRWHDRRGDFVAI